MPATEIVIPQLGEGLQEARIIRFLKNPGDEIARDEPVFEMETDKAVMEIESPSAGFLDEWLVAEGEVLPIGAVVGRIRSNDLSRAAVVTKTGGYSRDEIEEKQTNGLLSPVTDVPLPSLRNLHVSPRERQYAHQKNITDEEILSLYRDLGRRVEKSDLEHLLMKEINGDASTRVYSHNDISITSRQRTLIYRLQRGVSQTIPATLESFIQWDVLEQVRKKWIPTDAIRKPSRFLLFAWCVVQSSKNHPKFRSALLNENKIREYEHLHLGVAVSMPDDELVMARIPDADTLDFVSFCDVAEDAMKRAKAGEDQTGDVMQLSLTNLSHTGIRFAIPVVIAPAVATLFLGAPHDEAYPAIDGACAFRKVARMSLTFDHRLINGVGGARFLAEIKRRVERLPEEFQESIK